MNQRYLSQGLLIALLLLIGSLGWVAGWGEGQGGGPPPTQGGPLMAGVRFSSWQGPGRVYTLEISGLELIPKRLGPFKLGDSRDIKAQDCRLEIDEAELFLSFQEMGRTLVNLAQPLTGGPAAAAGGEGTPRQSVIVLPPKIVAAPFAGRIACPGEAWVSIRADLASFDPQDPRLCLKGNVVVGASDGASLKADEAGWKASAGRLLVEGRYTFRKGKRRLAGHGGQFSLAGGKVRLLKPTGQAPAPQGPPGASALPANLLLQAFSDKNLHGFENFMLPLLAAAQEGGAVLSDPRQPIPAPWTPAPHPH